ncbi:MAG: alkaline phosphatase family protein [Gemmatimonadota bacterium]|nr:alkaline phosphatase family protein [Gemmatimonadota bacterium]
MNERSAPPLARLIVIGIDAASPELLDAWTADGTLPHLRLLLDRGLAGRTRGIEGFFVGSTWPSLYTGTNPARHGVHYLLQLVPGTYRLHRVAQAEFVRQPPFWRALSCAGRRVAVLDVPLSRLEADLNGVQTVEWGGHDSLYGFHASPPSLATELRERFGEHPVGPRCDRAHRTASEYRAFTEALEAGARRKATWTRELLARGGWDLFMQVFTEAHCAGHQCWHLYDPAHPAHDPGFAAAHGDPLRRVYRAIDTAIGEVLELAGDANVVVFSAHGMSYRYGAQFLLHDILVRLGVMTPLAPPDVRGPGARLRSAAVAVWQRLPSPLRARLRPLTRRLVRQERGGEQVSTIAMDPARSFCFPVNNGLAAGGIRLNLIGREPLGRLAPGAEANTFCDRLVADLMGLVDDRTGRSLVRRVLRTAELYRGEYLDHLPDLVVEWNDEVATGSTALAGGTGARVRARSPAIGVVEGANDYGRSGEHRPGGWFVAAGPGIERGRLDREVSLMDLAPTFARMLGAELPDCDGRPIPELLGGLEAERGSGEGTPR